MDENLEDRIRRHQKIMRSRYSRFLRRRSMWEGEDHTDWPRHISDRYWSSRSCGYKPSDTTKSSEAKPTQEERTVEGFHRDFDAFRAAFDRNFARDPYRTLFGRRMASHPWITNPSWTGFSWLSHRDNLHKDEVVQPSKPDSADHESAPRENANNATVTHSEVLEGDKNAITPVEEDYQYDPISMRKVPIKKPEAAAEVEPEPKKSFLEKFFAEHDADIPVKKYKPHQGSGYGASTQEAEDLGSEARGGNMHPPFDSGRKQEMRDLMKRIKGNNLDTTAQFTESRPNQKAEEDSDKLTIPTEAQESPELDDSTPLFSGTAYADRFSNEAIGPSKLSNSAEAVTQEASQDVSYITTDSTLKGFIKQSSSRLEPALDRIQANTDGRADEVPFTLQTAVDRHASALKKELKEAEDAPAGPKTPDYLAASTEEDIDLLRGSDVRAATRTARVTKQEAETLKSEARAKLEADYASRLAGGKAVDGHEVDAFASKLTKRVNHVWDHIREYPHGIVAKTMNSVNAFNDNYKKYVRPEGTKSLTDKLVFQDQSLSKSPSIYKNTGMQTESKQLTPSQEVLDADKERSERTIKLRRATIGAKEEAEARDVQLSQLSADIRAAYEDGYGTINVSHRQPELTPTKAGTGDSAPPPKPHPLLSASVKPGVSVNSVIDEHVGTFEPKLAALVDSAKEVRSQLRQLDEEVEQIRPALSACPHLSTVIDGTKDVRRELHEAHLAIRAIESGRPETVWNALDKPCPNYGQKRIDWQAEEMSANKADQSEVVGDGHSTMPLENKASSSAVLPSQEPKKVPEPVFTPSGSPVWNDEQPPSIESLRRGTFDSKFIILAYNPSTSKVEFSPMNEPAKPTHKAADPVGILSRLKNAPEFLRHFALLKRAGYSLFNGKENMLIFKKKQPEHSSGSSPAQRVVEPKAATATASTSSASATKTRANEESAISSATVLEEIPKEVEQTVGPAGSTARFSRPLGDVGQVRVKRQEEVFSGTIRPNAAAQSSSAEDDRLSTSTPKPALGTSNEQRDGVWKRFTRSLKQTVMIVAALGGGAYTIGFIAEGMGAETQKQKGVEDTQARGPRKRIVMTGQRPGIYSTESSR
ncbi:hypothetical protein A1O3_07244 [Capronia epimyces CBS 606.96]|uniref:Uncharacterized protein n=1 Tax=Capronia epimyces CBS 606.96 TaxID=1182542 RepID=W9XVE6_9EURO|nr:uncharacterized protein A1O3_07244 [Capronia epimyces CBS 606.96]EXJ80956.1 hypothetical protein A1O3_07244 [Capronia epimyces CBS 606.96]